MPARVQRFLAGIDDAWASRRSFAVPAMARHQDRRKLLMLALVLNWWGSAALSGCRCNCRYCGRGVWVRSGRRVSALFAAGARYSAQPAIAGKLVAFMQGIGFSSPGLPRGFLACCVVSAAITDGLGVSCAVRRWADDHNPAFAPARFPQLWVKEA